MREKQAKFIAWTPKSVDLNTIYTNLPLDILDEVFTLSESSVLERTKKWCGELLKSSVNSNYGFIVIDGKSYPDLSDEERQFLTKRLIQYIGKPLIHKSQHLKQDIVCNVRDQGYRFTNNYNQNFHNSNQEAIEHTESTELQNPIRIFLLSVINPASKGGHTRLVSIYALLETLEKYYAHYLPELEKEYVFDTGRGERTRASILSYETDSTIHFRWMRAFLENGKPFTQHWNNMTDEMFDTISQLMQDLRLRLLLGRGDIGIFNNRALLHARDAFLDYPNSPPRWLLRSWFE